MREQIEPVANGLGLGRASEKATRTREAEKERRLGLCFYQLERHHHSSAGHLGLEDGLIGQGGGVLCSRAGWPLNSGQASVSHLCR